MEQATSGEKNGVVDAPARKLKRKKTVLDMAKEKAESSQAQQKIQIARQQSFARRSIVNSSSSANDEKICTDSHQLGRMQA